MKQFNISHSLLYFAFVLFCLNSHLLIAQRTASPSHKKGDKIEVKVNIDGKDVWIAATVGAVAANGTYKIQLNTTQTFSPNSIRKIPAPPPANTGGGQAANPKPTNPKPTNTGGGQAANPKPASYKAKDKVEVEIDYKGGKIWVEGTYMQEFSGKHMAQFKFKYGSGSDFFTANQIRPFTGNLTPLNTGGGGAATGGGNATGGGAAAKPNPYKKGEKVEVCLQDCGDAAKAYWVEATYDKYVNFSNMKGHLAAWNTGMGSGTKNFEDNQIRKSTGKLKNTNLTADVADPATIDLSKLENDIIAEVNMMRKDPMAYANKLQEILDKEGDFYLKSMGDNFNFKTSGEKPSGYNATQKAAHKKDIQDLIVLLKQRAASQKADASKLKQLKKNNLLATTAKTFSNEFSCDAAAKLVKCQAKYPNNASKAQDSANNSHVNCDCEGPMDRVKGAGYVGNTINECLFPCGKQTAKGTVLGFLIDFGVASKGHRLNLTNEASTEIGVGSSYDAKTGCIRTVIKCGFN